MAYSKNKKSKLTREVTKKAKKDIKKTFGGPSDLDRMSAFFSGTTAEAQMQKRKKKK